MLKVKRIVQSGKSIYRTVHDKVFLPALHPLRKEWWKDVKIIYMWGFNPDEQQTLPNQCIKANQNHFSHFKIYGLTDVEQLLYKHPSVKEIWNKMPHWIMRADLGRLMLIYEYGGVYLDVDCLIRKDFFREISNPRDMILFVEYIVATTDSLGQKEKKTEERRIRIAQHAFACLQKNHPFLKKTLEESVKRVNMLINCELGGCISDEDILWSTGPDMITSVYHDHPELPTHLLSEHYLKHQQAGQWRK